MFPDAPWDIDDIKEKCVKKFGIESRPEHILDTFGGRSLAELKGYSNIFFSNAALDPYKSGSPLRSISDSVISFVMEGAAHQQDLRKPEVSSDGQTPSDPNSVIDCRNLEKLWIKIWLQD